MNLSPKTIAQTFDNYAKSQLTFVQNVAEMAAKPSCAEYLYKSQVVEIIQPLLCNINSVVRINAVLVLARLADNSELCAKQILCSKNLLSDILGQIASENKYYKKNSMNLIRNLSKHSLKSSEFVVKECDGINAILTCMKDFDLLVKEIALQAICSIVHQNANISQLIVNSGVLTQIVQCLKEQQQNLKLNALSTLNEMAKHNQNLAQTIVDAQTLHHVVQFLSRDFTDTKIQKSALILVNNIVKHSSLLGEKAIESNLFPDILLLMAHPNEYIRDKSAEIVYELVKHNIQISEMIVNTGGIVSLLNVIMCSKNFAPTSTILTLGYIAEISPAMASAIIHSKALSPLIDILKSDKSECIKSATIWTLGMLGKHSSKHSKCICTCGGITAMMDVYIKTNNENELQQKCKSIIQLILNKCDEFIILEKLLNPSIPVDIMSCILAKISRILHKNSKARRSFITNGHLKMIQKFKTEIDSDLSQIIDAVNCCFPQDIIQMVDGNYPESLMKTVDKYVPKSQCIFYNNQK